MEVVRYVLGFDHLLEDGTYCVTYRGASVDVDSIQNAKFFKRSHAISSMESKTSHKLPLPKYGSILKKNNKGELKKVISIRPFLIPFVAQDLVREYLEVD